MKTILMASGKVGYEITHWLLKEYRDDIFLVVTTAEDEIMQLANQFQSRNLVFRSSNQICKFVREFGIEIDIGFLVWWPRIVKHPLLGLPKQGFINTHPSLLPYNRGKHYNFWALVEQVPFGVSLHFVDEGVDTGDIVAQKEIYHGWEDNGSTLYLKATNEVIKIFKEEYPKIRSLNIRRRQQNLSRGSFHKASEIDQASLIDLEKTYRARDLLNLLRARTFPGYPACRFYEDGHEYEVRVEITKKS